MDCSHCSELNQPEFGWKTCTFKNRRELLFFLLNTLLNIKCFTDQLYYCENRKECLICITKRTRTGYEYDLYKNMFDLDFLVKCHADLYNYLNQLFKTKKHCTCFILSNEYNYLWKDWFNGRNYRVSLSDAIKHKEQHDINKIRNNDLKIELIKLNY